MKIDIRDLAFFVKANLQGLINDNWNTPAGDMAYKINNLIKEVSDNRYGYFFDECYYITIKLNSEFLKGGYIYEN